MILDSDPVRDVVQGFLRLATKSSSVHVCSLETPCPLSWRAKDGRLRYVSHRRVEVWSEDTIFSIILGQRVVLCSSMDGYQLSMSGTKRHGMVDQQTAKQQHYQARMIEQPQRV